MLVTASRPATALAAGLLILLTGCGSAGPPRATGTVALGGKPLVRVTVGLVPEMAGVPLNGSSDDQGTFILTPPAGEPITPGSYKVVVTDPNPKVGGRSARADDPYAADQAAASNPPIPVKYTRAETTTVKVTVEVGKPITIDLPAN